MLRYNLGFLFFFLTHLEKKKKKDRKLIIIVTIPLVGAKVPLVYERAQFR